MKLIRTMTKRPWLTLSMGAAVAAISLGCAVWSDGALKSASKPVVQGLQMELASLPTAEKLSALQELDSVYADLVDAVSPAVVHVRASFGGGSGFIYSTDGWIITNDHVVGGEEEVTIVLADGREIEGKVYSAEDAQIDLALVKIDGSGLETLELSDSDAVRVGQHAVAIGAPFGLENSVTIGHVSAKNREAQVQDRRMMGLGRVYSGMIQTDASINPGNSGGPLIDVSGKVIGVNSTIQSGTGTSVGIGFAIPANTVKIVAEEIIESGKFDRGLLGFVPRNVAPYKQHELGIAGGALASDVSMDRPAFEAGIRDGDIILEVDGRTIKNQSDLLRSMYRRSPGETAQVVYLRDGEKTTASIKLDDPATLQTEQPARPEMPQERFRNMPPEFFREGPRSRRPDSGQRSQRPVLGINVETVGEAQRSQFKMPSDAKGAVVTSVTEGGLASQLGFEVGDVITFIDGVEVTTAQDVVKVLSTKNWGDRLSVKGMQYNETGTVQFSRSIPLL